jgi:hypothetical protein
MAPIPPAVIGTTAPVLDGWYTHSQLNALFMSAGFPGDSPEGNKTEKCTGWLRRGNQELNDPLAAFGRLIAEMMDAEIDPPQKRPWEPDTVIPADPRERIHAVLAKEGLSYRRGGYVLGAGLTGPSRSLGDRIAAVGVPAIEIEYRRALETVELDPEAAITAACSILESVCKTYIDANDLTPPNKQVLGSLWSVTAEGLGLTPKALADDDLKRILQGLFSIADGIAALRTHEGSAHGRSSSKTYRVAARHARLAVHAAHTMALFVLETWVARKKGA